MIVIFLFSIQEPGLEKIYPPDRFQIGYGEVVVVCSSCRC